MSFMCTQHAAQAEELIILLTVSFQFLIVVFANWVFLEKRYQCGIDGILAQGISDVCNSTLRAFNFVGLKSSFDALFTSGMPTCD